MTQESTVDDMDTDGEARPKNIDDGADDQRSPGGGGGAISVSDDKANTAKDGGFMQETNPSSTRIVLQHKVRCPDFELRSRELP